MLRSLRQIALECGWDVNWSTNWGSRWLTMIDDDWWGQSPRLNFQNPHSWTMIEPFNPSAKNWDLLGFQATSFGLRQKLGLVQKHVLIFVQSRHSLNPLRFRLGRCHEISGFERTTSAFTHPKTLQDRHNSHCHMGSSQLSSLLQIEVSWWQMQPVSISTNECTIWIWVKCTKKHVMLIRLWKWMKDQK